jgi:hypothetical protein
MYTPSFPSISIRRHAASVFTLVVLFTVMLISALSAFGQADVSTGTLKGSILDQNGETLAGAAVTVTDLNRGITRTATSNSDGVYQIPLLQPGRYQLQIEAHGFAKALIKGIELTVGQIVIYDVKLNVGTVTSEIVVAGESPLIQIEQTQQANTINQSQIAALPNINRNMTAAVFTLPGVASSEATRTQQPGFTGFATTGFSIGGSNGRNNLSTIDGGENEYGSGQYRVFIPVDSIQEFQVNRNSFAAEFGFTVGSSVNIVTKSGSNQYHGSAYGYYRNNSTQAVNFIDQLRTGQEPYSQNVNSGVTAGGPIVKGKLFFFTSYEYVKTDLASFNFLLSSPTALGINGNTPAGIAQQSYVNQLANSGNPTLVSVADGLRQSLVPQSNANLLKMMTRDNGFYDNLTKSHTWITRVDWSPGSKDSLSFRFELSHATVGLQTYPDGAGLVTRDYSILTNWSRTFSANLINQLRVQIVPFNKADNVPNLVTGSIATLPADLPGSLTIAGFAIGGFVPSFTFGSPAAIPYLAHQKRFQFEDTLSWTRGSHILKFGASYRPVDYHVEDDLYFAGQFNFADNTFPLILAVPPAQRAAVVGFNVANKIPANGPPLANLTGAQSFVFGLPSFFHQGYNNPAWQGWAHYFGAFVQDSWRVSPKLTLDFGGRLDVDAEPSPLHTNTYFSPRFGFAWTPFSDQKTVIRGGAGIFQGPIDVLIPSYGAILDDSGKYINQILPTASTVPVSSTAIYAAGIAAGLLPFGHLSSSFINALGQPTGQGAPNRVVFQVDPHYENPYSVQASLSIQHELMRNLSLEVGYLMYHGVHLQMPVELNYSETGVVDPFVGPRYSIIDKTILQKVGYESIGKSIYHALTVSLSKRLSSGFQFNANYTFSKSLDDVIDFSSSQTWFRPTRLNLYRSISVFDFPHVFVANAVYNTPFKAGSGQNFVARVFADMTFAPILTMRSGIPFSIRMPSPANGVTSLDANFATPFAASRDSSRGYPYYTLDLRIQKTLFLVRDRGLRIDLIAEGTNILNRVNFNKVWDQFPSPYPATGFDPNINPVVTFANGSSVNLLTGPYNLKGFKPTSSSQLAGTPLAFVGADNARQVQFGLRFAF